MAGPSGSHGRRSFGSGRVADGLEIWRAGSVRIVANAGGRLNASEPRPPTDPTQAGAVARVEVAARVRGRRRDPRPDASPSNPLKNPSYPQRVPHPRARPLAGGPELVRGADRRRPPEAERPRQRRPDRAAFERLYAQMLGARDQVADAARRLPGETGDLYEEDQHRLEEAVAALDRVLRQWDARK